MNSDHHNVYDQSAINTARGCPAALSAAPGSEALRPDLDRFGPDRDQLGHIAFGHGMHFCLGAPLARMEAVVAFGTLLHRCPDLELATLPDRIPWQVNPHLRGPAELPVRFTPQSR